jgi:hypothetical protein
LTNTFPITGKILACGAIGVPSLRMSKKKNYVVCVDRDGSAVALAPAMNLTAGSTINILIFGEIAEWWGVNKYDVYWALKN